jgi:ankyrin repeat protein
LKGHTEVVRALLAAGADVNAAESGDKVNSLMAAAAHGDLETVRALIEGKADLNAKTSNGNTALMLATAAGHQDVVQLLKSAGAQ